MVFFLCVCVIGDFHISGFLFLVRRGTLEGRGLFRGSGRPFSRPGWCAPSLIMSFNSTSCAACLSLREETYTTVSSMAFLDLSGEKIHFDRM